MAVEAFNPSDMSAVTMLGAIFGETVGQGWEQGGELALAFVLAAAIGLEREVRQKSAGLRTHTLVGLASALIVLVSKYGFNDVLSAGRVVLDPSRVAAQIVSGIGFIGGGLIFVRKDLVRGLTTAASVWLTAAVGMAAGAGLPVLAVLVTAGHFVVVLAFLPLADHLPRSRYSPSQLHVIYRDGEGVLRRVLKECIERGFLVSELSTEQQSEPQDALAAELEPSRNGQSSSLGQYVDGVEPPRTVSLRLTLRGSGSVTGLVAVLTGIEGVLATAAGDSNVVSE